MFISGTPSHHFLNSNALITSGMNCRYLYGRSDPRVLSGRLWRRLEDYGQKMAMICMYYTDNCVLLGLTRVAHLLKAGCVCM